MNTFSSDERTTLLWRSNLLDSQNDILTICYHHYEQFGRVFERNQHKCIGLDTPKGHKAKGQKAISLFEAIKLKEKGYVVVPGQKLCRQCMKKYEDIVSQVKAEPEKMETETETEDEIQTETEEEPHEYMESPKKRLNTSLETVGVSPANLHGVAQHSRVTKAKEKLKTVLTTYEESISQVYSCPIDELRNNNEGLKETSETAKKPDELDTLLNAIKEKLVISSYPEKIQLLTLAPDTWSRRYCAEYFNVSEYLVRKARDLKKDSGILATPLPKKGKSLPQEGLV